MFLISHAYYETEIMPNASEALSHLILKTPILYGNFIRYVPLHLWFYLNPEWTEDLSKVAPTVSEQKSIYRRGPSASEPTEFCASFCHRPPLTLFSCIEYFDCVVLGSVHLLMLFSIDIKQVWSSVIIIGMFMRQGSGFNKARQVGFN